MNQERTFKQAPQPPETEADQAFAKSVREPVGQPHDGRVVVLDSEIGTGYILEDSTGRRFGVARTVIAKQFDLLSVGTHVRFLVNAYKSVAKLI